MTITFIGHGYVGLVTACVFADFGNQVYVVGHTPQKIERLKKGDPIIYEPGLAEVLKNNLKAKRLHFTLDYNEAVSKSDIVFITVGTPSKENGEADLSSVYEVSEKIATHLKKGFTVVSCKSTVPVGTNKKVEKILNENKPKGATVAVASCPEFLREGTGLYDTLNPDRVVIGSDSQKAIDLLLEVHKPLGGVRVICNIPSAELIKYAANAMLATKISFANLISFYCEAQGGDVETVLDAVGLDTRIGRTFLYPGLGYGGSCLPKDVKALIQTGLTEAVDTSFLTAVEGVNLGARKNFLDKVYKYAKGKHIALWGLSFKPDTDDIRAAPSLYVLDELLKGDYTIHTYDPEAIENIKKQYGDAINYSKTPYEAAEGADILCILTEWNEFKQIDLKKVKRLMKNPVIIDGRNIYDPVTVRNLGFTYVGVGRNV